MHGVVRYLGWRIKPELCQCFNTKARRSRRTRRHARGCEEYLVERQISVPVTYKNEVLDCCLKLDLLVNNSIIVEVKSVDKLLSVHKAQLLSYLRLRDLWLGLVVNFN